MKNKQKNKGSLFRIEKRWCLTVFRLVCDGIIWFNEHRRFSAGFIILDYFERKRKFLRRENWDKSRSKRQHFGMWELIVIAISVLIHNESSSYYLFS